MLHIVLEMMTENFDFVMELDEIYSIKKVSRFHLYNFHNNPFHDLGTKQAAYTNQQCSFSSMLHIYSQKWSYIH